MRLKRGHASQAWSRLVELFLGRIFLYRGLWQSSRLCEALQAAFKKLRMPQRAAPDVNFPFSLWRFAGTTLM
jgi:hypothetical protein